MAKAAKTASWYVDERVMVAHGVSRRTAQRWRAAGAPVDDAEGMAAWAESKRFWFRGPGLDVGVAVVQPEPEPEPKPEPKARKVRAARSVRPARAARPGRDAQTAKRRNGKPPARRPVSPLPPLPPAPASVATIVMDRRDHQLAYILARTKLADEQADAQRMKNAERYGDLIAKDRHEAIIREHLLPVRDYLEDLPARFSSRANPGDPAAAAAVLADVAKKLKELLRRDDLND
jgi:phage terminase Nu1 subunit (DNA packaging protein)